MQCGSVWKWLPGRGCVLLMIKFGIKIHWLNEICNGKCGEPKCANNCAKRSHFGSIESLTFDFYLIFYWVFGSFFRDAIADRALLQHVSSHERTHLSQLCAKLGKNVNKRAIIENSDHQNVIGESRRNNGISCSRHTKKSHFLHESVWSRSLA